MRAVGFKEWFRQMTWVETLDLHSLHYSEHPFPIPQETVIPVIPMHPWSPSPRSMELCSVD
jgi:hypothetical protein